MISEGWFIIAALTLIALILTAEPLSVPADRIINLPGQPQVSFHHYAGYITVYDENQPRHLIYYFVEAEIDPASKPLVLWLNGGPGCSSVGAGAFCEHGPFRPSADILLKNEYSWNKEANMLYLESPAGVGFSYSANKSFYTSVNDEMTARDNLAFLEKWLAKFPEYKNRDLFITGESYGGELKTLLVTRPLCSTTCRTRQSIDQQVQSQGNSCQYLQTYSELCRFPISNNHRNLIGNPLLEYNTDFNSRAEFYWSHGLISDTTYEALTSVCNYSQYRRERDSGSLTPVCSAVANQVSREISSFVDIYDVTLDEPEEEVDVCVEDKTVQYLNRKDVQEAFHAQLVGITAWTVCSDVLKYKMQDLEIPTIHILDRLVRSGIRVWVYSGDQDSVIPLIGTRILINGLAKELGLNTSVAYRVWFAGRQVASWTQGYGDILTFATIRGASHEAPFSQPQRSLVLFKAFLAGKPLPETSLIDEQMEHK
ncbi:Peptidase S10 [Theobroma cacao]|nr:Peptidase S10 [Theobroma cacao]